MEGLLNETTDTLHKRETGRSDLAAVCGATSHVSHDNLRMAAVETAATSPETSKCGRCFDSAGGY
jgi:hypothetical protein